MKKLLILLLFLGFSFGQEPNSFFIGTWKSITTDSSKIFLKNGNGYTNGIVDGEDTSFKFKWSVIESNSDTFDGTLILDYYNIDVTYIYSFRILSKEYVKNSSLVDGEDFFEKYNLSYGGGELLVLTDSKYKNFADGDLTVYEKY
tara:strand:- start:218 stop:652 length:435 start_codon:yes stop_codon:yes gene_type:complete